MIGGISKKAPYFLILAVALVGLLFAALVLSASIAVIGFKLPDALWYGVVVLLIWVVLEGLGRLGEGRFMKYEPWILMAVFFLFYVVIMLLAPEMGQRKMPYDSLRAQMSLEAGHIAFYRPLKFYYWVNYDLLLSIMGIVFSPKLIVGQILNAICRAAVLYPVFRLGERISGRRMARFATIATALSPALTLYSTVLVGDFLSAMFFLYAIYFFAVKSDWERFSTNNLVLWLGTGLLLGLGTIFKTIAFLYFFAFMVFIAIMILEKRKIRMALLLLTSMCAICLAYKVALGVRSDVFVAAKEISKASEEPKRGALESFAGGVLYEMWLGLCVQTGGSYSRTRDRAFRSAPKNEKIAMVKNMLLDNMKKYPEFFVYKFKRVWGTNDSPGSILWWYHASCQNNCYNARNENYCPTWLAPLLRAEHLLTSFLFFLGASGFVLAMYRRRRMDSWVIGVLSLAVVLSYAGMSMIIESHGRYRTSIYPFFFMIIPFAGVWFEKDNPVYVRICRLVRKVRGRKCTDVGIADENVQETDEKQPVS